MERERAKFVGCQVILWALIFPIVLPTLHVLASENSNNPDEGQSTAPRLFIEPIAGLTTIRHLAPTRTAIPLGTALDLYLEVPGDAQVTFSGATVTSRDAEGIKARCLLDQEGPAIVAAICTMSDGTRYMPSCRLDVVSIAIGDISVAVATPTVAPFDLDENAPNAATMAKYFGESIADLVETTLQVKGAVLLDGGRRRPRIASVNRRFRTSIFRRINFHADVHPQAFAPLMEWRIDGLARAIGADRKETFSLVGEHRVLVGPPSRSAEVVIDTYSVSITSHVSGYDIVPEGEWIMFEAVTDPPGFEDKIAWVTSTKYGTAEPVRSYGASCVVQFNDTRGIDPANGYFQWLGVRADNAVFGQDQKPVVSGHSPFLIQNGTVVTVIGDGFPLDRADMDLAFFTPDDRRIPIFISQVTDTEFDGDGNEIEGVVEGIFDTELGLPLKLQLESYVGCEIPVPGEPEAEFFTGESIEGIPIVGSPDDSEGDEPVPPSVAGKGRKTGEYVEDEGDPPDPTKNKEEIEFDPLAWEENSNYKVGLVFWVKYKSGGATSKAHKYQISKGSVFTTDATPTLAECLEAIVLKMNALLVLGQDGGERTVIFQNFEWSTTGTKIELKKKAGSPAGTTLTDPGSKKKPIVVWDKQ